MDMPDEKAIEEFAMKTQLTSLPRDHPQWKQLVVVGFSMQMISVNYKDLTAKSME